MDKSALKIYFVRAEFYAAATLLYVSLERGLAALGANKSTLLFFIL